MQSDQYCSVEEVSAAYGVDAETVRRWCRLGIIKGAIHAGRQWRIPKRYASGKVEINIQDDNRKKRR